MEKLTSILAVALRESDAQAVLDRAMRLASQFGARLEVLVGDAAAARAVAAACRQREFPQVATYSVASDSEREHELILRRVLTTRPDLVVKVPARAIAHRPMSFFDEDLALANECPVPVLLVRGPGWQSPPRFAAAVDVSDEHSSSTARSILHTAGFLALRSEAHLDILYSECETHDEVVRMRRAVRLAQLVREYHVGCERLQMFSGEPQKRLPPLIAARHYDVLVLGGQSRRQGLAQLVPGTASRILSATVSDVILVRAADGAARVAGADLTPRASSESRLAAGAN